MLSRPVFRSFAPVPTLFDDLDRLFTRARPASAEPATPVLRSPRLRLRREEDALVLLAEVPGLAPADLAISVNEGVLTLSADTTEAGGEPAEEDAEAPQRRVHARFERRLRLPDDVDDEAIVADLRDGLLELRLPRRAHPQPRQITINAA